MRHDLLRPNHVLNRKWLLVEITVTFLVVVVLVAIVEEMAPRFKPRLMIICGLLATELAEDWFQG